MALVEPASDAAPPPEPTLGDAPAPREAALDIASGGFWREPVLAADVFGEVTAPPVPAGLMSLNICWQATGLPVPPFRVANVDANVASFVGASRVRVWVLDCDVC